MQTVTHKQREGCWEGLQVCAIRLQATSRRDAGISQRESSFTRWLRLLSVSSLKPIQERRVWTCTSLAPDPPSFHLHLFVRLWSAFLSGLKTSSLREPTSLFMCRYGDMISKQDDETWGDVWILTGHPVDQIRSVTTPYIRGHTSPLTALKLHVCAWQQSQGELHVTLIQLWHWKYDEMQEIIKFCNCFAHIEFNSELCQLLLLILATLTFSFSYWFIYLIKKCVVFLLALVKSRSVIAF